MDNKHSISGLNKRSSHLASIRQSFKLLPLAKLNFNIQNDIQKQALKTGPTSQNLNKESILTQADEEPSEVERRYENVSQYFQNKYQTLQKLGSGSNAFVYKCQEKQSQRLFAVKKVNVQPQQIEEIRKNYCMIAELNHPQICKYQSFYYDRSQNVTYTVMEYCPFPSLGSCKLKNEEELISLVKQIISSLEYLHQNSICHRDIKPQNILYDQKNKIIKIIDFQISKKLLVNGLKRDLLTIVGSSYYFAPQIYLGGGYDERIDLWSLGITIFKMITGYTPFESQYCLQTIQNILKGEVIFCDQIFRTYNLQARNFVLRLLKPKHQRMSISECKKHPWLAMKSSCNNQ